MRQESKSERFRRVAEARTNKIIKMIRLLGNCSNRLVYAYESGQVHQIFAAIREETDKASQCFLVPQKAYRKRFSLSGSGESPNGVVPSTSQGNNVSQTDRPTVCMPLPDGTTLLAECFEKDEYPCIHISWVSGRKLKNGMNSELLCTVEYDTDRAPGHEVSVIAYQSHDEEPKYCKPFIMEEKEEEIIRGTQIL